MKGLLIGGATVLSIILGFWPGGTTRQKPLWWRALTILSMLVLCVLALGIPTGGSFKVGAKVGESRDNAVFPVRATVAAVGADAVTMRDRMGDEQQVVLPAGFDRSALTQGRDVVVDMKFLGHGAGFEAVRVTSTDPWVTLPLIPGLEERARNLYFHVPTAWLAQLAWFVALFYAIVYMRKRRLEDDARAATAAALGALFCILATTTGAVWAKFNWGTFWNWDPRQTSIFIVLVIYGAYFALRSALEGEDQRARISAIYLILLAVPVIFLMFVLPRMSDSLHPGSLQDVKQGNLGPVLSAREEDLDPIKQVIFALGFFSWAMLFFWMLNVSVRARIVELAHRRHRIETEEREVEARLVEATPV
jgi:heme exporter protein C